MAAYFLYSVSLFSAHTFRNRPTTARRRTHLHEETDFWNCSLKNSFCGHHMGPPNYILFQMNDFVRIRRYCVLGELGPNVCEWVRVCQRMLTVGERDGGKKKRAEGWIPASLWDSDALQMSQSDIHSHAAPPWPGDELLPTVGFLFLGSVHCQFTPHSYCAVLQA